MMIKSLAIALINRRTSSALTNVNTIFSNPGTSLNLWWLEPANHKFESGFFFILNNSETKQLLLFEIPRRAINKSVFRQREEKQVSQIIIPISDSDFTDRRGFNFNKFLVLRVDYS